MKKIFIVLALLCGTSSFVIAQQLVNSNKSEAGSVRHADLAVGTQTNPDVIFHNLLQIHTDHSFKLLRSFQDRVGTTHDTYQQYYKGVKVEGGTYSLHSKGGLYDHISGNFEQIDKLSVMPKLTENEALRKTTAQIGATKYAWEDAQAEQFIKALRQDSKASYFPKGELLISKNWNLFEQTGQTQYHLCYAFYIRATAPDLDLRVFIDAHTGVIIAQQNMVCNIDGRANTLYNGNNVPIKTSLAPNTTDEYILHDKTNNIRTLNAEGSTLPQGIEYTNYGSNVWGVAKPEHDAHYGATKTVEYWKNTHFRNSYDGNANTELIQLANAQSVVRIYGMPTPTHDNASWTQSEKVVRYGNGENVFKPLVALDVVAHEIGHAYSNGFGFASSNETEALHEGLSDIWASCVDRDNWTIGEQVMASTTGASCIRSITEPQLPTAHTKGATTYNTTASTSNTFFTSGAHGQGLVLAHWFYLLCEGKIGTNELNTSYVVEGIGKEKAEKIVYGTYPYLNANGWASVANAALQSAKNLYGECSREYACTYNALYAVNLLTVGNKPNIQMSLPTLTATLPADYSVICDGEINNASIAYTWGANTSDRISYEWQISDAFRGLHFIDDMGNTLGNFAFGSQVKFRYIAPTDISEKQYVTITARAYCNGNTAAERRIVGVQQIRLWLGIPNIIKVLVPNFTALCVGETYSVQATGGEGRASTEWTNESPTVLQEVSQGYNFARYRVIDYGTARVGVRATNRCGSSSTASFSAPVTYFCDDTPKCTPRPGRPCPLRFVVAPNPAAQSVQLKNLDATDHIGTVFSYEVYNTIGNLVVKGTITDQTALDVSQWQDGLYLVLVQTPQGVQSLKLVVQKGTVAN